MSAMLLIASEKAQSAPHSKFHFCLGDRERLCMLLCLVPKTGRCLFTSIALTRLGYSAVEEWRQFSRSPSNYALDKKKLAIKHQHDRQALEEEMGKQEGRKYASFLKQAGRLSEEQNILNGHIPKAGEGTLAEIATVLQVRVFVHFGDLVQEHGSACHEPVHLLHTVDHFDCLFPVPNPRQFSLVGLKIKEYWALKFFCKNMAGDIEVGESRKMMEVRNAVSYFSGPVAIIAEGNCVGVFWQCGSVCLQDDSEVMALQYLTKASDSFILQKLKGGSQHLYGYYASDIWEFKQPIKLDLPQGSVRWVNFSESVAEKIMETLDSSPHFSGWAGWAGLGLNFQIVEWRSLLISFVSLLD